MHEPVLLAAHVADPANLLPDVRLADRLDHVIEREEQAFDCSAVQVMGCPCESSGGSPAASEAMILPSRSPQASPSASIFTPGFLASKRRAMSLKALIVCGSVSVCQTRTTFQPPHLRAEDSSHQSHDY